MEIRPIRKELSEKNMLSRGIPKHFLNVSIDSFESFGDERRESAKHQIEYYLLNLHANLKDGKGLYIYGSNGVGKTMLASIIVKEAYRFRYTSKRLTFVEYLDQYTHIWKAQSTEEREELEDTFYHYIKAVDFLVLEELGKEQTKTEMAVTILEDLLRYREEKGLCTIICTNMSLKELMERYKSKSVESLIRGSMNPLKIYGEDRRSNR